MRDATGGEMELAEHYQRLYQSSDRQDVRALWRMRQYGVNPGVKPFAHPYYWAGFVFHGC
jgi:CHAT domain-containing protein